MTLIDIKKKLTIEKMKALIASCQSAVERMVPMWLIL